MSVDSALTIDNTVAPRRTNNGISSVKNANSPKVGKKLVNWR